MITEEEYKKAQEIVDQYHNERQQQADWELEDDDDYDEEEERQQEEYETAASCTCGAYGIKNHKVYHIADCICGAE